jgi:hypothetical protein
MWFHRTAQSASQAQVADARDINHLSGADYIAAIADVFSALPQIEDCRSYPNTSHGIAARPSKPVSRTAPKPKHYQLNFRINGDVRRELRAAARRQRRTITELATRYICEGLVRDQQ